MPLNPHIRVPIFSFLTYLVLTMSYINKLIQKRTVLAGVGLGLFIVSKACVPSRCG